MFRHGESTDLITGKKTRQESFLLFSGAIQRQLIDTELGVGGVGKTDTSYTESVGLDSILERHQVRIS
jgi:hypothetical protein